MRRMKRVLCAVLACVLGLSLGAFGASAQEGDFARLIGDIDGNGVIDISDATLLQTQIGNGTFEADIADTSGDGTVDISDVTVIQMFAASLPVNSRVGQPLDEEQPVSTEATEPAAETTAPMTQEPTVEPTAPLTQEPTNEKTEPVTQEPTLEPTVLTLDCDTFKLGVGEAYPLTVHTNASDAPVFTSDNPVVAAVDSGGVITAKGEGTAFISCAAGGAIAVCEVTVCPAATSLTLNKTELKLAVGEVYDLNSTVNFGAAAYYRDYSSDNEAVASVTEDGGYVTARSVGTAQITCMLRNGVRAVCQVTVLPFADALSLNKNVLTLEVGDTFDFDSTVPAGTAAYFRDYYSEDTGVAEIAKSGGLMTTLAPGTTRIYCELGNGVRAYATVTVTEKSLFRAKMTDYLRAQLGNNNRTYIDYINKHSKLGTNYNTAWCAVFAWCCLDSFAAQNGYENPVAPRKYVSDIADQAKKAGALRNCADTGYVPKPGDLFLTATVAHPVNGQRCHIGYVEYVETDKNGKVTAIHTIEGNFNWETTASAVTKVTRSVWKPGGKRYGAFISEFIDITALFPDTKV